MNETETPRTDERYWRDYGKQPNPPTGDEMRDFAQQLERELIAVTEQRDEARRLAEKYRYLSCDSQEEADAEVLPWENNQPTKP